MKYTKIEQQIIRQADAETEVTIKKITDQICSLISEPDKGIFTAIRWHGMDHAVKLPHRGMILTLVKTILLEELTVKRRERALNSFFDKFNAVVNQIENFGIELEGITQETLVDGD